MHELRNYQEIVLTWMMMRNICEGLATDEAEKFKTDLDLDGRVNSVERQQIKMIKMISFGEQTSDQGKSNRKNSRGKFGSKIPVKI